MSERRSQLGPTIVAILWFVFFVALIFKPEMVRGNPILAVLAIGGCIWWAVQARRTGRRRRGDDLKRLH